MSTLVTESEPVRGSRLSLNGLAPVVAKMTCVKRDGRQVPFDPDRITAALRKCFASSCTLPQAEQDVLVEKVAKRVVRQIAAGKLNSVGVEGVQQVVIGQLWAEGLEDEATHYQDYRERRRKERYNRAVSEAVAGRVKSDRGHFKTDLQYFQFMDKFSRWLPDQKRRETWEEAVFQRVLPFLFNRPKVKGKLTADEMEFLGRYMYELKAGPAMRVVQMAGPALERCNMGVYNCLSSDTQFVTDLGVRSFNDFADGESVTVMTHTGSWKPATVRQYGEQKLNKIRLRRGKSEINVRATANHRWLLRGGESTTNLQVKDQIITPPSAFVDWDYDTADPDEKLYWAYGVVYGDGTLIKRDGTARNSMVRLCGEKAKYLERFEELGFSFSYPPSCKSDPVVYTGTYLKTLPSLEADGVRKTRAFVRGWLDADGNKNTNPGPNRFTSLQITGEEGIRFARSVFPAVGVFITNEQDLTGQETNYGVRSRQTSRFGLVQHFGESANGSCYSVASIEPDGEDRQSVWCLEVQDDHSFVLPAGVVTGNCTYLPISDIRSFGELLYILMQGSGAGFSVEYDYVGDLPRVRKQTGQDKVTIIVEDSTESWCDALIAAVTLLFEGRDFVLDTSRVRKKGARLKTKGGKASGPEPLVELMDFVRDLFLSRQGRRLSDIDVHDICCMIGNIVQVGGVRRAALISLSDLNSRSMRDAKSGAWWDGSKHRSMANNSAVYLERPTPEVFLDEWQALVRSKSGERGICNRQALEKSVPDRRQKRSDFGFNPCGEIILRPYGVCNLSIAVARPEDTEETLTQKAIAAAYFGTIQATCTDFNYVRPEWRKNAEEESMLGVDITGHADCPLLFASNPDRDDMLVRIRQKVNEVNADLSARFGIARSAADTCVKPSGDSAIFFDCGSGISARFAECQWRYVRASKESSIAKFLIDQGVPYANAPERPNELYVFGFLKEAPANSIKRDDQTALEQLDNWIRWKKNWAEHSVSATIYVQEWEWVAVGAWVYEHFDEITGLSFLPKDNGTYQYAPNVELTREEFEAAAATFPTVAWEKLSLYEDDDETGARTTIACFGGDCS